MKNWKEFVNEAKKEIIWTANIEADVDVDTDMDSEEIEKAYKKLIKLIEKETKSLGFKKLGISANMGGIEIEFSINKDVNNKDVKKIEAKINKLKNVEMFEMYQNDTY